MAGSLFTNYIMCLCKCGQLTERLIVKVSTEIENELGIVIESTVEEVRNMWSMYGNLIPEDMKRFLKKC